MLYMLILFNLFLLYDQLYLCQSLSYHWPNESHADKIHSNNDSELRVYNTHIDNSPDFASSLIFIQRSIVLIDVDCLNSFLQAN